MSETIESRLDRLEESVRNFKAVAAREASRRRKSLKIRLVLLAVLLSAYAYILHRASSQII
jgi:hypothetical protein